MADLKSIPELKTNEADLREAVEAAVPNPATPESASPENLRKLPAQVEEVTEEMVAAPVEVSVRAIPKPDIASVLEASGTRIVHEETVDEKRADAAALSAFLERTKSADELLAAIRPDADKNDDLPLAA